MRLQLIILAAVALTAISRPSPVSGAACIRVEIPREYNSSDIKEKERFWRTLESYTGNTIPLDLIREGEKRRERRTPADAIAVLTVYASNPLGPSFISSNYRYNETLWVRQRLIQDRGDYTLYFYARRPAECPSPPDYIAFLNTITLYFYSNPHDPEHWSNIVGELVNYGKQRRCHRLETSPAYSHMRRLLKHLKQDAKR